ncbi:MAG: hypothetical protein ACKVOU_04520 [Cytophagales bacterium]
MPKENPQLPYWMGESLKKYWETQARTVSYDKFIFEYVEKMIAKNKGIHWDFVQFLGLSRKTQIDIIYFKLNISAN